MGLVYAEVKLSNPASAEPLAPVVSRALVDSGSTFLVIPYAGPVQAEVLNRRAFVGALVMGDEVLLGAIPMEDMDLVIHPLHRTPGPNPLNPNVPGAMAKGLPPRFEDQGNA